MSLPKLNRACAGQGREPSFLHDSQESWRSGSESVPPDSGAGEHPRYSRDGKGQEAFLGPHCSELTMTTPDLIPLLGFDGVRDPDLVATLEKARGTFTY